MAMAIGACSSDANQSSDAMPSGDTMPSGDAGPPDHPGADGGPNNDLAIGADGPGRPCFVPTDCSAGIRCCVEIAAGSGVVSCQASDLCVSDGVSTFIACATSADCPAVAPTCTPYGSTPSGDEFRLCLWP